MPAMLFRQTAPSVETHAALAVHRHSPDAVLLREGTFADCNAVTVFRMRAGGRR